MRDGERDRVIDRDRVRDRGTGDPDEERPIQVVVGIPYPVTTVDLPLIANPIAGLKEIIKT